MPRSSSGIYKITNLKNGKIYIGQSQNIYKRREQHFVALRHRLHENLSMQLDYLNDGRYFRGDAVEFCSLDQLNEREQYWIKYYNSFAPHGYNLGWVPYTRKKKQQESKQRKIKHYHHTR